MAVIKGVKEKVHLPLYDSLVVKPREQLGAKQSSNVLRFFQDVTGKTKLQTNMQASSLLPHWNTFEARALRVVLSDLSPQFPEKPTVDLSGLEVKKPDGKIEAGRTVKNLTLNNYVDLSRRLECHCDAPLQLSKGDVEALSTPNNTVQIDPPDALDGGNVLLFGRGEIERLQRLLGEAGVGLPPSEQVLPHNGCGDVISRFIYNTVTSFYVGEKVMIQVPTWFFPAGAGPYTEDGKVTTHGYPSPEATFRFAEPIFVDTQQNFRVEIEVPESDVLADLQRLYGPLYIWVVLDGFMTRDVQ